MSVYEQIVAEIKRLDEKIDSAKSEMISEMKRLDEKIDRVDERIDTAMQIRERLAAVEAKLAAMER